MELIGVRVEVPSQTPIVLLRETGGERRVLPIFIGTPEAAAIAAALEGVQPARPLTHDLLKNVLDELAVGLSHVVVTELRDNTFFAELHLETNGSATTISSRPSDAIALAVRGATPIFADESVVDEAGYTEPDLDEDDADESGTSEEEFRRFIDEVSPEDFQ
jgi:bifunctional DNase/RNase